jgi:hypothetical protein
VTRKRLLRGSDAANVSPMRSNALKSAFASARVASSILSCVLSYVSMGGPHRVKGMRSPSPSSSPLGSGQFFDRDYSGAYTGARVLLGVGTYSRLNPGFRRGKSPFNDKSSQAGRTMDGSKDGFQHAKPKGQ